MQDTYFPIVSTEASTKDIAEDRGRVFQTIRNELLAGNMETEVIDEECMSNLFSTVVLRASSFVGAREEDFVKVYDLVSKKLLQVFPNRSS